MLQRPAVTPALPFPHLVLFALLGLAGIGVTLAFVVAMLRQPAPAGMDSKELQTMLDPFRIREHLVTRTAATDYPLVPSIGPLADEIPLHKIDTRALDKKLVRTPADKMVIASYFAKKFGQEVITLLKYTDHVLEAALETRLDPLLLLAIISVESNFDPDVESPVGAQGLMQVMTRIHAQKFQPYGGTASAFRPEVNIRVGALIVKQALALMGSLPGALRFYVGAARPGVTDGGFVDKVLGEYGRLISLLGGNTQSIHVPLHEHLALQQRFDEPSMEPNGLRLPTENTNLR